MLFFLPLLYQLLIGFPPFEPYGAKIRSKQISDICPNCNNLKKNTTPPLFAISFNLVRDIFGDIL